MQNVNKVFRIKSHNNDRLNILHCTVGFDPTISALWGPENQLSLWTVLGEIITVLPCIWLVRPASSLRLAETNSEDPFFFSEVLAQI